MSDELKRDGCNVGLSALLDELHLRRVRTDAHVMDSAAAAIIRLQTEARVKGRLLADIYNHPDVELPDDLHRRLDRLLMFGPDTEHAVSPNDQDKTRP